MKAFKLLLLIIFSFPVFNSHAADMTCTPGSYFVDLGVLQEGINTGNYNQYVDGGLNYFTCQTNRKFLYGASLSYKMSAVNGQSVGFLRPMIDLSQGTALPEYQPNKATNYCIGSFNFRCNFPLSAGAVVSFSLPYRVLTNLSGVGRFWGQIDLYQTPRVLVGQSEKVGTFIYSYVIGARPCSVSDKNLSTNFKDLDNRLTDNPSREVGLTVNCPGQTNVDVMLSPSQSVVTASQGLSKTSLAGLNMQVYRNGSPVVLNQTSTQRFQQGSNAYRLTFYPRLATSSPPVGSFSANYTLTFDYK